MTTQTTTFPPFACTLTGEITNDPQLIINDLELRSARSMNDNKIATYRAQIDELKAFQQLIEPCIFGCNSESYRGGFCIKCWNQEHS